MSEIDSIEINKNNIMVKLKLSQGEYELLGNKTSDLLLLPVDNDFMNRTLTTGKLGNSNRIMMPKKILEKFDITILEKKVPSKTFLINDEVFLLIKLKKSTFGIPVFKEVE